MSNTPKTDADRQRGTPYERPFVSVAFAEALEIENVELKIELARLTKQLRSEKETIDSLMARFD